MKTPSTIFNFLACPKCKGSLHLNQTKDGLVCDRCRLIYPIRDEIPVMLVEEAAPLGGRWG
jgi:uncharacterized protein YbaR (Trm112 family)